MLMLLDTPWFFHILRSIIPHIKDVAAFTISPYADTRHADTSFYDDADACFDFRHAIRRCCHLRHIIIAAAARLLSAFFAAFADARVVLRHCC